MSESDQFKAKIELLNSDKEVMLSRDDQCENFTIDTSARITSTSKVCMNSYNPYTSWDTSWGKAPTSFDVNDYYYLMWRITGNIINPTQPYNLTITDVLSDAEGNPVVDGEAVAYKFPGGSFKPANSRRNLKDTAANGSIYYFVITKHPKSTYEGLNEYTLKNSETITLTPYDGIDEYSEASASAVFHHYQAAFSAPGSSLGSEKRGNSNWYSNWPVADYGLQELKDGPENGGVDHLSGNIRFDVNTWGYVLPYTKSDNGPEDEIESYGQKNVKFVITDDSFYLNQSFEYNGYKVIPSNDNEHQGVKLTSDDFKIEHIDYTFTLKDSYKDTLNNRFVEKAATPTENDILYFYFKFGSDSDWTQQPVAWYDAFNREANFDENYIKEMTSGRITFNDNVDCVGFRAETVNAHSATIISARPYCWIKRSDNVLAQSEGVNRITLTNISNYSVTTNYNTETNTGTLIYDRDSMAHDYIIGVEKESEISKSVTFTSNSPLKRRAEIGWQVNISEHYESNEGRVYIPQETGVFYDLLPSGNLLNWNSVAVGVSNDNNPLSVRWLRSNEYEFKTTPNYKGTGRILLTVKIKTTFNSVRLSYTTFYSWDSIMDFGTQPLNTVAYETGNAKIAGGYPDDGGDIADDDKAAMSGLDSSSSGDRFIYEQKAHPIRVLISTRTGLVKTVREENGAEYKKEISVRQSRQYIYRLRYSTTIISKAKNMILYDSLENAKIKMQGKDGQEFEAESNWHGTLTGIDLSQPKGMGIAPVVYYSSVERLDLQNSESNRDISDTSIWQKAEDFGDISAAKAIAVDLRHDTEGNEYVLQNNKSVYVELIMTSPEKEDSVPDENSPVEEPTAFNNVQMRCNVIDMYDNVEPETCIHFEYSAVHFKIYGDIGIQKVEQKDGETIDENNIKPVENIGFRLTGRSKYGTEYGTGHDDIKYTNDEGKLVFTDIEQNKPLPEIITEDTDLSEYYYKIEEIEGNNDYFKIDGPILFRINEKGETTVGQQLINNGGYYLVGNRPRVHADIEFTKKDLRIGYTLNGARFVLSGESYYFPGTQITYTAVSGQYPIGVPDGVLRFENVEMGTYILSEVEAPADHALLKSIRFKVKIEENGTYSMTAIDSSGNKIEAEDTEFFDDCDTYGPYTVFNEPYHRFTILKTGLTHTDTNVAGAVFCLWGTSDNFNYVYKEETTDVNGQATFSNLEAGKYKLKEISAPSGYDGDYNTERVVIIDTEGNVTISGLNKDKQGRFLITNAENGTITVYKEWRDGKTNEEREQEGLDPDIYITSDVRKSEATFSSDLRTLMLNLTKDGQNATHVENIKSFKQYTRIDGRTIVEQGIANGTVIKADDSTTENVIYIWLEDDGTLYWWSDARDVYFPSSCEYMFSGFTGLKVFDNFGLNFVKVTTLFGMFSGCTSLQSIDFSKQNLSNVTTFSYMLNGCHSLESIDFSGADLRSITRFCADGWAYQQSLTNSKTVETINFHGANLSSLQTFYFAFSGLPLLKNIDFGECTFSGTIKSMVHAFYNCPKLEKLDFTELGSISGTETFSNAFAWCSSLKEINLSSFDTSICTDMSGMFNGCSSLETVVVSGTWNTENVTSSGNMFSGCVSITGKYDTTYDSGKVDKTYARVDDPANGKPGYFTDEMPSTGSGARTVTVFTTSSSGNTDTIIRPTAVDKSDPDRWVYTFSGIDQSRTYYAIEENARDFINDGYYVSYRNNNGRELEYKDYIDLSLGEDTIINGTTVPVYGSLTIEKILDEEQEGDLKTYDYERVFKFILTLTDQDEQPVSETIDGNVFTNGRKNLTIKAGNSTTIKDIPVGYHYSVTEVINEETDYYFTASLVGAEDDVLVAEGEINENVNHKVTFKNTKKHFDILPAGFTVKKVIDSKTAVNEDVSFDFYAHLEGLDPYTEYRLSNDITFVSKEDRTGDVSFSLKHNESVDFVDLPDGATATVVELAREDSIASYEINANGVTRSNANIEKNHELSTDTITAKHGETTLVTFTNKRIILQDLKIKKTVTDATDGNQEIFRFKLSLTKLTPNLWVNYNGNFYQADEYGEIDIKEFVMSNGSTVTIEGINVGAEYWIEEEASSSYIASYKMTDANNPNNQFVSGDGSGMAANQKSNMKLQTAPETMDEGEDVTVEFINTKVTHDIIVAKEVKLITGQDLEKQQKDKEFAFTVELSGLDTEKKYFVDKNENREPITVYGSGNGVYSAVLKHGESFTIKDLPVGATYKITEAPEELYFGSFNAKSKNNGAVIALADKENTTMNTELATAVEQVDEQEYEVKFTFTNTYNPAGYVLPNAGVGDSRPIAVVLLGGMVFFAAALWFVTKRQKYND